MSQEKPRINSAEVASVMLKLARPVSAPELTDILSHIHPDLLVEKNDIYIRLKGFYESRNAACFMNDEVRPRTFHLKSISCKYFKFRNGRATDLKGSKIACGKTNREMPQQDKELKHQETRLMCRQIFNGLVVARQEKHILTNKKPIFRADISLFRKCQAGKVTREPSNTNSRPSPPPSCVMPGLSCKHGRTMSNNRVRYGAGGLWGKGGGTHEGYTVSIKPPI